MVVKVLPLEEKVKKSMQSSVDCRQKPKKPSLNVEKLKSQEFANSWSLELSTAVCDRTMTVTGKSERRNSQKKNATTLVDLSSAVSVSHTKFNNFCLLIYYTKQEFLIVLISTF
jgi:hypothetical protein